MKIKIEISNRKLINAIITVPLTYICLNTYLIKKVYFSYRIIDLNKKEYILRKICKELLLKKSNLRAKFL